MSIKLTTQIWEVRGLKATDKLVLLALADHANDEGECWPSMARLAEKCDMTPRGVRNVIRRLEDVGYVATETSSGRTNNRYTINPVPKQLTLFGGANSEPRSALKPINPEQNSALDNGNPEQHSGLNPSNPEPRSALNPEQLSGLELANPERHDTNPERRSYHPGTVVPPNRNKPSLEPSVGGRKRATRLSDDWQLPKSWGTWATDQGLPEHRVRTEAMKFANHWQAKSGKDATKRDWEKTWRNWILRAIELQPATRNGFASRSPPVNRFDGDEELQKIREQMRQERAAP
ncbi:MAG: helix-turn-helix domain-containing protein [Pseudomonadota bacterium]